MQDEDHLIYNLCNERIKIRSKDPTVRTILQAFFHYCRTNDPADYMIIYNEVRRDLMDPETLPIQYIPDFEKYSGITPVPIGKFMLFYLKDERKLYSFYPKGVFTEEEHPGGYTIVYENTYDDKELPPHTHEVVYSVYWLLECLEIFRLHAAYIRYQNKNFMFAGKGAVGKTTSALNLSSAGGQILCDDELFFKKNHSNEKIEVFPVSKEIAVTEHTLAMFRNLCPEKTMLKKRRHKYLIPLNKFANISNAGLSEPDIIIFPTISTIKGSNPQIKEMSDFEGFTTFLNGEILYPPVLSHNRKIQLEMIESLVKQCGILSMSSKSSMKENLELINEYFGFNHT